MKLIGADVKRQHLGLHVSPELYEDVFTLTIWWAGDSDPMVDVSFTFKVGRCARWALRRLGVREFDYPLSKITGVTYD